MRDNSNELKRNTLIIAIASFGSKMITFILGPLYSYFLTTEEYGRMDLIVTTSNLLLPFISLNIYEATFRYSFDTNYDRKKIVSTSFFITLFGILTLVLGSIMLSRFYLINIYYGLCIILSVSIDSLTTILTQFARGINKMKIYAFSGVVNAIILLISNLIFMVLLKYALMGWIISFIIAKLIVMLYLACVIRIDRYLNFKYVDKLYIKEFLRFCIPLLPTSTMWWIMNVSDRYMLAAISGTAITGIYSVSNKFPNILSSFENVFFQAWQTTAIHTSKNDDKDEYYSSVLQGYIKVMVLVIICTLAVIKPLICNLFSKEYHEAWVSAPILLVGVLIHAISGNLGSLYTVFKNTKGAFFSTLFGAVTNIILNILFIPKYGMIGAALTTLAGYIVTLLYRCIDTKKFVKLKVLNITVVYSCIILLIQFVLTYIDSILSYIIRIGIILIYMIICKDLIMNILKLKIRKR